jgi:Tol biopolymer transport system component
MVYSRTEDTEAPSQLVWFDRDGKPLGPQGIPGSGPSISPDGKAFAYIRNPGGHSEIWVRDTASGREIRVTSDASRNTTPLWSPNGERMVYRSERGSKAGDLYQRAANGAGQDELLVATMNNKIPNQWSRDGRYIVYSEGGGGWRLWVLPVPAGGVPSGAEKPALFPPEGSEQSLGQLSPDSRWLAYTSPEAGRQEVFVRPFPATGDFRWKISTDGGVQPRWRRDGRELYFVGLDGKMMAVSVTAGQVSTKNGSRPSLDVGTPVALFETHIVGGATSRAFQYDVTADGTRFLIATSSEASAPILTVEVNGIAGLKK